MKINIDGVDETLYKEVLDNGLEIYIVPNKNVNNYYLTFSTKFGSIDTEFKIDGEKKYTKVPNGVAHFLEHITFKTKDGDASDYFPSIGCQCNAFTSYDVTCYEVFGYANFKEALNYLLDFVQTPYYNDKIVNAEKGIITEEIKMRTDNPHIKLQSTMNEAIFTKDKRRILISGNVKDVKSTTLDDIMACYNTFYHPSNMFVIITGDVNPEEAIAIITENQSKKNYGSKINIKRKKQKEPFAVKEGINHIKGNVEIPKAGVSWKVPLANFKDLKLSRKVLNIYITLITNCMFGRSSEIRERLVSGNIITDGPYISRTMTDEYTVNSIIAETPYPERFIAIIKEGIKNISISEEDLTRKKRVALSSYILNYDYIEPVNYNIMSDIIEYGEYKTDYYKIYNELDIKTAKLIAERLINDNISITILEKELEKEST